MPEADVATVVDWHSPGASELPEAEWTLLFHLLPQQSDGCLWTVMLYYHWGPFYSNSSCWEHICGVDTIVLFCFIIIFIININIICFGNLKDF
jgi:hypothetical protein